MQTRPISGRNSAAIFAAVSSTIGTWLFAATASAAAESYVDQVLPYSVVPFDSKAALPTEAASGALYSNIDPPSFQHIGYFSGGASLVGTNLITNMLADDITTTTEVTGGAINQVTFSYFNDNTTVTNFRARIRFFADDGADGGPGTYLTGASLLFENEPALSGGRVYFSGSALGLSLGSGTTIWAGVAFDNNNGSFDAATGANFATTTADQLNNLGQQVFDPPTVGSSQDLAFRTFGNTDPNFVASNPTGTEVSSGTTTYNENLGWEFVGPAAVSVNTSWNVDANGAYTDSSNWSAGLPQSTTATATFGNKITAPRTVSVDSNQAIGTLIFSSNIAYTLAGAGTLNIGDPVTGGTISVTAGSHLISAGLATSGNASISIATGAQLTASNFNDSTHTLTKLGAGTLNVNRTRATTLTLSAGTMKLIAGGARPSQVGSISIAGGVSAPTAILDITDNDVIFSGVSLTTAQKYVSFARDGGAWDKAGIKTTSAPKTGSALSPKGIGVISGAEYLSLGASNTAFDGVAVASGDTLLKFTYNGDADFNGVINSSDYHNIDTGFQNQKTVGFVFDWFHGDFDYNGLINSADYALIDAAYQLQSGTLRSSISYLETGVLPAGDVSQSLAEVIEHNEQFGVAYANAFVFANVPEPALSSTLGIAVSCFLARRRRN